MSKRLVALALLVVATVGFLTSAASAAPPLIEPTNIEGVEAKRPVVDTILSPSRLMARTSANVHTQRWMDPHGHTISISTDLPAVDLSPFAGILAGTRHRSEINDLRVQAVTMAQVGSICGNSAAVACYAAEDPDRSYAGQMWFAIDDPDVVHTLVHEYGHHMDNQLLNLSHLGYCGYSNDGSRNWFFERDVEDDILGAGVSCSADTGWEYLLGELYAEDFVALNEILNWTLPSVRSPTRRQLDALDYDIRMPFDPMSRTWKPRVRHRALPYRTVTSKHWTFLTVTLSSPRRRDFDLYLYRAGKTRSFASSRRTGRFDRIARVLPPGRYDIGVHAYRGSGRARVGIAMD